MNPSTTLENLSPGLVRRAPRDGHATSLIVHSVEAAAIVGTPLVMIAMAMTFILIVYKPWRKDSPYRMRIQREREERQLARQEDGQMVHSQAAAESHHDAVGLRHMSPRPMEDTHFTGGHSPAHPPLSVPSPVLQPSSRAQTPHSTPMSTPTLCHEPGVLAHPSDVYPSSGASSEPVSPSHSLHNWAPHPP